jgi:hypothetical protein
MTASTQSDASGSYEFAGLPANGSYIVTPTKSALPAGTSGINTVDIVATQRHFLGVATIPPGCRLTAADVNGDTAINTIDVVAIQRFYLGLSTGIANVGKYQFSPSSRAYPGIGTNATNQDYATLVFGDVAAPFAERNVGSTPVLVSETRAEEDPSPVAAVMLPKISVNVSTKSFVADVTTSLIDEKSNLVGFQGDFEFDERVFIFQDPPVQPAGITTRNWNVSGNVLPGTGPIKRLRVSGYSIDSMPLAGEGTLFQLRMSRAGTEGQKIHLVWRPQPDDFIFIDGNLRTRRPETSPLAVGAVSGRSNVETAR